MSKENRKRKKLIKKLLESFREPVKLSSNKGKRIYGSYPKTSSKDRRHSGRVEGRIIKPNIKYKEIFELGIEPVKYYDDWLNYRDGFREKKREEIDKIKKKLWIRRARKIRKRLYSIKFTGE